MWVHLQKRWQILRVTERKQEEIKYQAYNNSPDLLVIGEDF